MDYKNKTIIDKNGFIIDMCVLFIDNKPQYFEVIEDIQIVNRYTGDYVKPKWDFEKEEWIEGATEEEIKEWEESNKPKPKEPSEDEILISNVLLENATLKQKTNDLEEMTANLMLKIAELKGGNANV
ncbi:hypothetical protein [Clostridium sp. CMCC3677]|uniref:hypothetical protein n=1 Tax=Clostridium sp. CMCC3677 TaxID=2949963 RepID=UPI0013F07A9B|nr:hypothetical protein [Clostridium sp. CMCC3677]NFG60528.1 hypothetical protein [Clostridium botulinum]NFQ09829.1 hypothetical protein [Clostridium botulinum]